MLSLSFVFQAFGNHEFDNGVAGLMKPFMENINCTVLSANIKPDKTLAPTFGNSYLPYKIFTVGGERIGVVGYTSQETPALAKPGEWTKRFPVLLSGVKLLSHLSVWLLRTTPEV